MSNKKPTQFAKQNAREYRILGVAVVYQWYVW